MPRFAILMFVAFVAIVGVCAVYLSWWTTVLIVIALVMLAIRLIPSFASRGLSDVMKKLFDSKSRVLRDAVVHVHAVELTHPPAAVIDDETEQMFDDDERDPGDTKYVLVDATITPGQSEGPMHHWEPAELRLVGFERDTSLEAMADGDGDGGDVLHAATVEADGSTADDLDKITGPQRLRLVFACPRSLSGRAKLQYYFEGIGDFRIPA